MAKHGLASPKQQKILSLSVRQLIMLTLLTR